MKRDLVQVGPAVGGDPAVNPPHCTEGSSGYGSINATPILLMVISTATGWGLVVNSAQGFGWEGYLLGAFGLGGKAGPWSGANLGVAFAFVLSFLGYLLLCAGRVRSQERQGLRTSEAAGGSR